MGYTGIVGYIGMVGYTGMVGYAGIVGYGGGCVKRAMFALLLICTDGSCVEHVIMFTLSSSRTWSQREGGS